MCPVEKFRTSQPENSSAIVNEMNRTKKQLIEEIADLREKIKDFKTAAPNGPETLQVLHPGEELYQLLVENASEAILVIQDQKIRYVNQAAIEITGYARKELSSKTLIELVHPEDRELIADEPGCHGNNKPATRRLTCRIVDKHQNIRWVEAKMMAIKGHSMAAIMCFLVDITERKMEEEFSKAQKLESLSVLAGGIGHDFNNLLSGIMGNISLAKLEAERGEDIMESLEEALRVSSKASALTQQLLVFFKKWRTS